MNKAFVLALAAAGTLLSAGAAHAGNVQWSVGINLPVPGLVITGGPLYHPHVQGYRVEPTYAPAPVYYAPEPVYYAPEPVYYAPPPVYYPRHPQWRQNHRPAPVRVIYEPRYRYGAQPVFHPRHGDGRWEHRLERREDRRDRRD